MPECTRLSECNITTGTEKLMVDAAGGYVNDVQQEKEL